MNIYNNPPIVIRGGGDLATGTIYRLHKAGFPVLVLETGRPLAVRRAVSVCEAVYEGVIMGYGIERLLRAPAAGRLVSRKTIGDLVEAGEAVGEIAGVPVRANIPGVIRGLIHPSVECRPGMKIGDVDPRGIVDYCFTISEKSLAIAGGVMEAVSYPNR